MLFENKFFLKLYRKLEDGVNPDVEVTSFLTERGTSRMSRPSRARSNIAVPKANRQLSACCKRPRLTKATPGR